MEELDVLRDQLASLNSCLDVCSQLEVMLDNIWEQPLTAGIALENCRNAIFWQLKQIQAEYEQKMILADKSDV